MSFQDKHSHPPASGLPQGDAPQGPLRLETRAVAPSQSEIRSVCQDFLVIRYDEFPFLLLTIP
jgi:hypothetical protein